MCVLNACDGDNINPTSPEPVVNLGRSALYWIFKIFEKKHKLRRMY